MAYQGYSSVGARKSLDWPVRSSDLHVAARHTQSASVGSGLSSALLAGSYKHENIFVGGHRTMHPPRQMSTNGAIIT
jgi:hypothetical protein